MGGQDQPLPLDEVNNNQTTSNQAYSALVSFVIEHWRGNDSATGSSTASTPQESTASGDNAGDARSPVSVLNETARWQEFTPPNNPNGFVVQFDDRSQAYRILNNRREVMATIGSGENGSMTLFEGESNRQVLNLFMDGSSVEIKFPNGDYQRIMLNQDGGFDRLDGSYLVPGENGQADRWLVATQVEGEGAEAAINVSCAHISDSQATDYQNPTGDLLETVLTGVEQSLQMLGIDVSPLIQRTRELAAQTQGNRATSPEHEHDGIQVDENGLQTVSHFDAETGLITHEDHSDPPRHTAPGTAPGAPTVEIHDHEDHGQEEEESEEDGLVAVDHTDVIQDPEDPSTEVQQGTPQLYGLYGMGLALALGHTPTPGGQGGPGIPVSGDGPVMQPDGGGGQVLNNGFGWTGAFNGLTLPASADSLGVNGNFAAISNRPMSQRNELWLDTAVSCFVGNGDPANRQAIIQEILRSIPQVGGHDETYMRAFLQLSRVDAARRMMEAPQGARSQPARDFVMFHNALTHTGLTGTVLMDAIRHLPQNPNGELRIAGNGSSFVREALGESGVLNQFPQTAHPPNDLPFAVQDLFREPGLWDSAQRDVAQTQAQNDQQYRDIVGNILRPGSTVTTDALPAQLQALRDLNNQALRRYQSSVSDLEILSAARALQESNNLQEVQGAIQTLNSSANPMALAYRTILGQDRITNQEQLTAFRQRAGESLTGQITQDRNAMQLRFLEEPLRQQIANRIVDRPSAQFLENLQTQLQTEFDRGNHGARDTLDWVNAQLLLSRIGSAGTRATAAPLATELIQSITRPDGTINQHALSAAISLVGSAGTTEQWLQRRTRLENGGDVLPSFYTALSNGFDLPMAFRSQVATQLQDAINGLPASVQLSPLQIHTLSMGLQRPHGDQTTEAHHRGQYRQTVEEILRRQLRMPEGDRAARINAAAEAMINGVTGLGSVLMEADAATLGRMLPHLERLGNEGSRDAIILLSAMASNTIAGDTAQARQAARILSAVAARDNGRNLNAAIEVVSQTIQQRGDRGMLLEVLGNLSFMTGTPNFDTSLLLNRGYMDSFNRQLFPIGPTEAIAATDYGRTPLSTAELTPRQQQEHRLSAAFAMLADPRHLNDVSIPGITRFMTREMASALHEAVGTLSREQRNLFINNLREEIRVPYSWTIDSIARTENRLLALQAFGAFGSTDEVRTIGEILNVQVADSNPLAPQLRQMQQVALETMFSMLNSPDENVRRAVLDRLERQAWPPHLFPTFQNATNDLVENARHLNPQEQQRAFSMVPGNNNIRPPFSLLLDQMGVHDARRVGERIVAGVSDADQLTHYTLPILTAAASFNRLSPQVRSNLLAAANLPIDTRIDINVVAQDLARGEHTDAMDFLLGMGETLNAAIQRRVDINQELIGQVNLEQRLLMFGSQPGDRNLPNPEAPVPQTPEEIARMAPGPRAHALALSDLRRLEQQRQQLRTEQLGVMSWSQLANLVVPQTMIETPEQAERAANLDARIAELRRWLERHQSPGYVSDHERYTRRMEQIGGALSENLEGLAELRTAEATMAYQQFRLSGQNENADRILLNLWSNNQMPESLQPDFQRLWQRMAALGAAPCNEIPNFQGTPEQQMQQALTVLNSLQNHNHSNPAINGLESMMRQSIEHRAQVIINNQPAVRAANDTVNQFRSNADNLHLYFQIVAATADGSRSQSLINHLRTSSGQLRGILGAEGQPVRDNVEALTQNLRDQITNLPENSPARAMYQRMIDGLNNTVQPINPNSRSNRDLSNLVNDTLDGGRIRNREWYERAAAELVRFGVVTVACAGSQALCEMIPIPGVGHVVSMVVVPAVATAGNHMVDEGLYHMGLSDNGSYVIDAVEAEPQYDSIGMSHYMMTDSQVRGQLWQQYRGEFEMNAAALGFGWVGGRIGQGISSRLGLQGVTHAAPTSFVSRFGNNIRSGLGPGVAMSAVGFVDHELHLNVPVGLAGLGLAGLHGLYSGLRTPGSNSNLQRFLPEHAQRQPGSQGEQHIATLRSHAAQHVDHLLRGGNLTAPVAENLLRLMRDGHVTPQTVRSIVDLPANLRTQHIDGLLTETSNIRSIDSALVRAYQTHLETTHPSITPLLEQLRVGNHLNIDTLHSLNQLTPAGINRLTSLGHTERATLISSISSLPRERQTAFLQHVSVLSQTQAQHLADVMRSLPTPQVREAVARSLSENINPQTLPRIVDAIQTLPQNQRAVALSDAARLPGAVLQSLGHVSDATVRGRLIEALGSAAHTEQGRPAVERFGELVSSMPQDAQARLLESLGSVADHAPRSRAINSLLAQMDGSTAGSQSANRFLTAMSAIPEGVQRSAILNTLSDLPPARAHDFLRAFSHFGETPNHETYLRQLAAMPSESRLAFLNSISAIENAQTRFAAIGLAMGLPDGQITRFAAALHSITSFPPELAQSFLATLRTTPEGQRTALMERFRALPAEQLALIRNIPASELQEGLFSIDLLTNGNLTVAEINSVRTTMASVERNQRAVVLETLAAMTDSTQRRGFLESINRLGDQRQQSLSAFSRMSLANRVLFAENFERLPQSVFSLVRAVNEATTAWPNLTAHTEAVSDYFAARSRYQTLLAREAATLVGQGRLPNDGTAVAVLQQRVADGQGGPVLTMMHDSLARMRTPEIAQVESNLRMLQAVSDRHSRQGQLPGFQLRLTDMPADTDGMYRHGQNIIEINARDLLSPAGASRVGETLAHEIVHRNQDILIIRSIAQELSAGRTPVDPSTPQGLQDVQRIFRERTGFALDSAFASQVLNQHRGAALTPIEMNRAVRLAESIRTLTRDSMILNDRANTLRMEANNLFNNPEQLDGFLRGITDVASRRRYFGTDETPWLEPLLDQRRRGIITDRETAMLVGDRIRQHATAMTNDSYQSYRNALHEVEAWHATEIAESARLTPSEQPIRPSGRSDRPVDPRSGSSMTNAHEESLTLVRQQLARTPGGAPPAVVRAFESLTPQQLDLALTLSAPSLNALASAMRAGTIPAEALAQITSSATLLRRVDQLLRPPQGTTARPADLLRDLFRVPAAALEQATIQAARANVPNELLQQLIATVPSDRLYLYERLSPSSMRELLSINNATTRGRYEQAIFANTISATGLTEIRSIAGRSPEMAQLVEAILSRPRSRDMQYETTVRQLAEARLDAPTLTALSRQINAGTVSLENLGPLVSRGRQSVELTMRTIEQCRLDTVASQRLLSLSAGQADAVGRLLADRTVTPEMINRALGLPDAHRQAVLDILTQEQSRPAASRVSQEHLGQLIGDEAQAIREIQARATRPVVSAPPVVAPHDQVQAALDQLRTRGLSAENQTALTDLVSRSRSGETSDLTSGQAQALRALAQRATADGTTPLSAEHINFFVNRVLEPRGLTNLSSLTDMLVHHPNAAQNFRAMSQLAGYVEVAGPQGFNRAFGTTTGTPSLLDMPGWRAVSANGALVTTGGQIHLEHSGRVTIPAADVQRFDMQGTFRQVSRNNDGTVTIELRQPMQVRATAEDILLSSIGARAGGLENCANAVRAYLANVTHPDGLNNLIRQGRLIPPDPQSSFSVHSINYEGLDVMTVDARRSSPFPSERTAIVDPAQLQPGLYVARTRLSTVADQREVSHTFLVMVPREGPPFVFDPASGQRLPLNAMGNNLIIHTVNRSSTNAQVMGSN